MEPDGEDEARQLRDSKFQIVHRVQPLKLKGCDWQMMCVGFCSNASWKFFAWRRKCGGQCHIIVPGGGGCDNLWPDHVIAEGFGAQVLQVSREAYIVNRGSTVVHTWELGVTGHASPSSAKSRFTTPRTPRILDTTSAAQAKQGPHDEGRF